MHGVLIRTQIEFWKSSGFRSLCRCIHKQKGRFLIRSGPREMGCDDAEDDIRVTAAQSFKGWSPVKARAIQTIAAL